MTESVSSSPATGQAVTLPDSWRNYDLPVLFVAALTPCSTFVKHLAGAASTGDMISVTKNSATATGTPSSPHPALDFVVLGSTTNPGANNPGT